MKKKLDTKFSLALGLGVLALVLGVGILADQQRNIIK